MKGGESLRSFLIALMLFVLCCVFGGYIPIQLRPYGYNWAAIFVLILSLVFAIMSIIKGIRNTRRKEDYDVYNAIAVIGSLLILLAIICIGIFGVIFETKGLPG
jgi:amino acid transporter